MLRKSQASPNAQRGAVLIFAIIVLAATTLAAVALTRTVDTASMVAGNLAFQQAATSSGDTGIEAGIFWLQSAGAAVGGLDVLAGNTQIADSGYSPMRQDPARATTNSPAQSWDHFWNTVLVANNLVANVLFDCSTHLPDLAGSCTSDAAGNAIAYSIQRMCTQVGAPSAPGTGCSQPSSNEDATSSMASSYISMRRANQVYYRITSRVAGPRNTVSYVQALVAM